MPTHQQTRQDLDRQSANLSPRQAKDQDRDAGRDASPKSHDIDTDRLESGSKRLDADTTRQQQLGADEDGDIVQPDG